MKSSSQVSQDFPNYLNDESGLVQGQADRIVFPTTESEIQDILKKAYSQKIPITVSGAGTGIAGGRVPNGGWIVATDEMTTLSISGQSEIWTDAISGREFQYRVTELDPSSAYLTVPVSMTVKMIQDLCRELDWFYPPDPTERSCFIGGNVVTNASGARSFKYGATREWVHALRVILPKGDLLVLSRDDELLGNDTTIQLDDTLSISRPSYNLPASTKNVAGPVITNESQPIDLFIGNDGLFGIVTEVTLRIIRPPQFIVNIFAYMSSIDEAIQLANIAQANRSKNNNPIPMSVEYLDNRAVDIIRKEDPSIPEDTQAVLILEQDANSEEQLYEFLEFWLDVFDRLGVSDTSVAQTHAEIEHHKFLRHLVPETINEIARMNNQPKLGTDYAAPLDKMSEMMQYAIDLGNSFENEIDTDTIAYAIWSHFGDNHLHLNFLPRTDQQREKAKQLMVKFMEQVVNWNGSIAAEHGLGKKQFNGQPALLLQLDQSGLQQIYFMKKAIDPNFILNPGNLLGDDLSVFE